MAPTLGPQRLTFFNHKGGVGKTTLSINVAAALGESGYSVLFVDSDPQCNLTSYLFDDETVDDLLDNSDSNKGSTVWSAVRDIVNGDGNLRDVSPFETSMENVHLIAGDIRLAEYEDYLREAWLDSLQRKRRGYRGVSALSNLVGACSKRLDYDFVFYDTGPNIGPLNRSILLDCDFFIVPAACDLFSLRAIKTLGHTVANWIIDWSTIHGLAPESVKLMAGRPQLLGYVPQRFKTYGQKMSKTAAYYLPRLEKTLKDDVVKVLQRVDPKLVSPRKLKLGEVKDFGSLAPAAQSRGVPISKVNGVNDSLREEALIAFSALAHSISRLSHR